MLVKRKPIPKAIREQVRLKCNGRCAYCGRDLPERFHVDHVISVWDHGENNYDNLLPACPQCNNFKSVLSLEQFRRDLQGQVAMARKTSVNFRNAERFQQIIINEHPIVFYFETLGIQVKKEL